MLFQQPEYETAFHRLVEREIDAYINADPLLSRINRVRIPGPLTIQAGEGPPRPTERVGAEFRADGQAVLDGDTAVLNQVIASAAGQYMSAIKAMFYSQARRLNTGGRPLSWDLILDFWEQEDWSPDPAGKVEAPAVSMHPDVMDALGELSPRQRERYEELRVRKQNEFDARRRARRIP